MAKKRKPPARRRRSTPSLSALDKAVYAVLELLICVAIPGGLMVLSMAMEDTVAEMPHVLAARTTWTRLSFICAVLLASGSILYTPVFFLSGQPIFGRTDVQYDRQADPSLYPIFWKNRQKRPPNGAARREHARLRKAILRFLGFYGAFLLLALLLLVPHHAVYENHTLKEFGSFGQEVRSYGPEDCTGAYVETYLAGSRGTYHGIRIGLWTSDGRAYDYTLGDHCLALYDIVAALPPESIRVYGEEYLPDVFRHYRFTEDEIRTANTLFGVTE